MSWIGYYCTRRRLDVTEVLDFKILCVRREGAFSEREESSFQHLEGLNARRFLDFGFLKMFFFTFGVFSKGRARPPPSFLLSFLLAKCPSQEGALCEQERKGERR